MKFLQIQVRSKLDKSLHEKLITIEASLPEIEKQLSEIDISRDQKAYAEMAKKHSDVSTIVELFVEWKDINLEIADAEELLQSESDEEMKNEFEGIISENKSKLDPLIQKIKISLLPKDPSDDKDVLVEIRPGAGGEESAYYLPSNQKIPWNKIQGKKLSYNNYLDMESASSIAYEFNNLCCVIIKHSNPCGFGFGNNNFQAYKNAVSTDPISYFGGIVAFNSEVGSEEAYDTIRNGASCA